MKKFFILLAIFFPLFAAYLFYPGETVKISVEEGRTATQIARQLKDSGIIWSSLWFRALVKFTGAGKKIMPG